MRNTWKILNSILRCSRKTPCQKFVSNNKTFTNSVQIASEFNKFFAGIGPSLAKSIKHSGKDFHLYLDKENSHTCFFKPTDENEIMRIIGKLGSKKSPGHDGIRSDLVKKIAQEISYPLKIINHVKLV